MGGGKKGRKVNVSNNKVSSYPGELHRLLNITLSGSKCPQDEIPSGVLVGMFALGGITGLQAEHLVTNPRACRKDKNRRCGSVPIIASITTLKPFIHSYYK